MPKWVTHTLWLLLMLILLARWREVGQWLTEAGGDLAEMFRGPFFGFYRPADRLAIFGMLVVAVMTMWAIYWHNRSDN